MNLNPDQFTESCLDAPVTTDQKDEINKVLSRFFDIMFPAGIVFGAIALIVSIYRSYSHGWFPSAVLHISMYAFAVTVLIFRRRLPVLFLFYSMLGLICVTVVESLLTMGLASDALISLTVLCIFAGVFLGIREGLITLALGVLVAAAIGTGICTGVIQTRPMITSYLYEPSTWILHIAFIPMYMVPLILSINYMRKRMLDSIILLQRTNKQLQEEISRRVVMEKAEKALEAKLLQAQKMEALGTLTGGIAHDFNNILTALMGYGTILSMKLGESNSLKRYADNILSASEKASNLIKSLLSFSRLQPIMLKPINLNKIIHDTEKLLKRVITEDIALTTDLADEQINILADQTQIEQILFNLVSNARDAMPGGGRLKISTQTAMVDEEFIRINGFGKIGRYALLRVSDSGMGMDESVKQKIFDPFFTTKDIGKGTGLGLSTVYGIIKQNNGYVIVDSEPGRSTDFNIYLPLIKEEAVESKKMLTEVREGSETILVAEDNIEARFFIREILEYYGYRVVVAVDGDDAINKFIENTEISLVIVDSIMPKKNGNEVYESIKKIRGEINVLFISGHAKEVVMSKGIINSHVEFVSKPFSPEELLKKVGELLEG